MRTPHSPDPDYQKGFNEGYLIAFHLPALANSISRITNQTPRFEGLRDGQKQFILEQAKDQLPWLKRDQRTATKEQIKEKGINKEPDR